MKSIFQVFVGVAWLFAASTPVLGAGISSFFPPYADTNGTIWITINGSGFLAGTPLVVEFNGTPALQAQVTDQNGTQIQARLRYGTPVGSGPIVVKVGGNPASSSENFTVVGPGPYVHSFTPTNGSDNQAVTLTGIHLSIVTNITFAGSKISDPLPPPSDTSITVHAPAKVVSGPIVLRSAKGNFTAGNFYVPPIVKTFTPRTGRAGTNFNFSGTNLLGTTTVLFAGSGGAFTLPSSVQVLDNLTVQVTVPVGARSGKLRLQAPAGSFTTVGNFTILPVISDFSPKQGPPGSAVLITGANFDEGTPVIHFSGTTTPAAISSRTYSQLTAVVPAGAITGPISITATNGTVFTTPNRFYLPPAITGFTPNHSAPETRITITGQNFLDATAVLFDALPATAFFVTNNTTIGAIVPAGVNSGVIRVVTPAGIATSAGYFYAPPFIESFLPTAGMPGTLVTLTGSNFLGATAVQFNGTPATTHTVINNNILQAVVPGGAQTGPITVIAPAGTHTTTGSFTLTYTSDLTLWSTDEPDPVTATSNLVFTVNIKNNGPHTAENVVLSNTFPASFKVVSVVPSQGAGDSQTPLVVRFGSLLTGHETNLFVTLAPQTNGIFQLMATVSADYPDPNLANNTVIANTTVVPLALLRIRQINDRIRLAWPLALEDYLLQYQNPLITTGTWFNVTTPTVISGSDHIVTETNTGIPRFYRLIKPQL